MSKAMWPLGRDNPDCICDELPNVNCEVHITKMPTPDTLQDKIKALELTGNTYSRDASLNHYFKLSDESVAQIIKCIEDEGYIKLRVPTHATGDTVALVAEGYYTGQKFYDSFVHELKAFYTELDIPQQEAALEAAKRAAGL